MLNGPFKLVFYGAARGTLMTDSKISHHVIGATSLSCCQVTSTFRLPKPMSNAQHSMGRTYTTQCFCAGF